MRPDTALVSIMYANNEIGTVEPIAEIARAVKATNPGTLLHTDAVQAGGLLPLDMQALGVDLLALSGHKFYAPKGVGLLYVRRGTPLVLSDQRRRAGARRAGRHRERGLHRRHGHGARAGLRGSWSSAWRTCRRLRDRLIDGVCARRRSVCALTGHPTERMPNNASFTIAGADGESLLLNLDQEGICASSGAACTSGTLEISHVLRALRLPEDEARGCLRLTTGVRTTDAEVDRLLDVLPGIVERVREVTPSLVS